MMGTSDRPQIILHAFDIGYTSLSMAETYEVEIKSLLGSKENCEQLKTALGKARPQTKIFATSKQLNHYFTGGDLQKLYEIISLIVPEKSRPNFKHIVDEGNMPSIRTRQTDNKVIFVIKASVNSHSSANGVERIEFECPVDVTLDVLDKKILDAGFLYQAKWSREREEYDTGDMHVCIDKNAGYGYLAEFEKMIDDSSLTKQTADEIRKFISELGFEELAQDRLERMFAHYNAHWQDYYGTDNVFIIE